MTPFRPTLLTLVLLSIGCRIGKVADTGITSTSTTDGGTFTDGGGSDGGTDTGTADAGTASDGGTETAGVDADGDGYDSIDSGGDDCDDSDSGVFPGAKEICDGIDQNCDGSIDEGVEQTWYVDGDGDGFGDADLPTTACEQPKGMVADATDCDDGDAETWPGAPERCDKIDNNCDGTIDEDVQDVWYADTDGDGEGDPDSTISACNPDVGFVGNSTDCDDTNPTVNAHGVEICNGIDDDCNGEIDEDSALDASTWYTDADSDGYGDSTDSSVACDAPDGTVSNATDCDDTDSTVHPGVAEVCNDIDDDCDSLIDDDDPGLTDASSWYI
ncbi:MAG: hypothetical protein GXP62_20615, partial [Oligoflexia bacterium]|nr:hypothetical protein [Oligoflexia bacterium]